EREFEFVEFAGFAMLASVVAAFVALALYQRRQQRVIDWLRRFTAKEWFPRRLRRVIISVMEKLAGALSIMKDGRELFMVSFWTFLL
ncbi:hypothetical protein OFM13_31495, partial [Escherichia coli]|nr:hypothetical protein [Escherichia coli]